MYALKKYSILVAIIFLCFQCSCANNAQKFTEKVNALQEIILSPTTKLEDLQKPLEDLEEFVDSALENNSNFKTEIDDQGFTPRDRLQVLEQRMFNEMSLLYTPGDELANKLFDILFTLDEKLGHLASIIPENLNDTYKRFLKEGQVYSVVDIHSLIHIIHFVDSLERALAQKNAKYLLTLLNDYTGYANLIPIFVDHHPGITSLKDKNGKTFLDWVERLENEVASSNFDATTKENAHKYFESIKDTLKKGPQHEKPDFVFGERKDEDSVIEN